MTYATLEDVAAYVPTTGDNGTYTADTKPTKAQVERFLNRGYSSINAALAAAGYSTPVSSDATVYDELTDLEALYAAARVELVRLSSRYGAEERTRSSALKKEFTDGLAALLKRDLSRAGATHTSKLTMTGWKESEKESVESDTDRVEPRFKRGQFRYSGTQRPGGSSDDDNDLT